MATYDVFLIFAAGIFGTLAMDVLSVLAAHLGILSGPVKPSLIGRWGLWVLMGRLRHTTIAQTPPIEGETVAGVLIHYSIGVTLAFFYFHLAKTVGFAPDDPARALAYGFVTNVFPWLILFPSYGFGVCGLRGKGLLFSSTFNHVVYGAALGAAFWFATVHQSVLMDVVTPLALALPTFP